jgi:hypothetical protein
MAVYPCCLCCVVLCGYRSCDEPIARLCIRVICIVLSCVGTGPAMNRSPVQRELPNVLGFTGSVLIKNQDKRREIQRKA